MSRLTGYDGWPCWGCFCGENGEDEETGEYNVWFARGPSGKLLGPFSSYSVCLAALIGDVENEKTQARKKREEGQRKNAFQWRKAELIREAELGQLRGDYALVEPLYSKVESIGQCSVWVIEFGSEKVWFLMGPDGPMSNFHATSEEAARIMAAGEALKSLPDLSGPF